MKVTFTVYNIKLYLTIANCFVGNTLPIVLEKSNKLVVLVTGAGGFVGKNVVKYLSDDFKVVGLQHADLDICSTEDVLSRIRTLKPDVVINCSVYGGYHYQKESKRIYDVNWLGAKNLLDACIECKVPLFIQTGSSSEYGFKNEPMREDMNVEPNSDYASAKAMATKYCYEKRDGPTKTAVLRLFSVYGYFEAAHRLMPQIITHSIEKTEVKLGNPDSVRDFVFVDDVCAAFEAVITKNSGFESGEVFNVGSGKEYKLKDVIEIYKRIDPGLKVSWNNDMGRDERDRAVCWQADISKIKRVLGWNPKYSLEEGLRLTTEWFIKQVR